MHVEVVNRSAGPLRRHLQRQGVHVAIPGSLNSPTTPLLVIQKQHPVQGDDGLLLWGGPWSTSCGCSKRFGDDDFSPMEQSDAPELFSQDADGDRNIEQRRMVSPGMGQLNGAYP